jgi:putative membrane protein
MKKSMIILGIIILMASACSSDKDSVKQAKEQNQNSAIDEDISAFLTEAADARLMDIEEGKLAKARGTTSEIRQYGERMITDQTKLLHEIRILAASKNIVLPNVLSNEKEDDLKDLREKQGEAFDKAFIRMITTDHKRDVREFEKATDFKDRDIQKFASSYLPLIESHLDEIKKVRDDVISEHEGQKENEDQ